MKLTERIFREKVLKTINDLKDVPTDYLINQLSAMKRNLLFLQGSKAKIVSLAEHRKIKFNYNVLNEVIRDRNGLIIPVDKINTAKPRKAIQRTGTIKLYK
jgi:hypothetical protein